MKGAGFAAEGDDEDTDDEEEEVATAAADGDGDGDDDDDDEDNNIVEEEEELLGWLEEFELNVEGEPGAPGGGRVTNVVAVKD